MRTRRKPVRGIGLAALLLLCGGALPHGAAPARAGVAPGGLAQGVRPPQPPLGLVQTPPPSALPNLALPPEARTQPEMFVNLMRMGDAAMLRGDITRARALYERAAALQPTSSAALIAAGKTYDPNVLWLLGVTGGSLADPARARAWYERARALGDPAATLLLAPLR